MRVCKSYNIHLTGPLVDHMTSDDVAAFLAKIGLHQYTEAFQNENIDGDILLNLVKTEGDLSELGVTNPLHLMKIMQLFPREVQGTESKYSNDHLSHFLQKDERLHKYIPILKEHGIDGDMILQVNDKLVTNVLKQIGVNSALDRSRICKYKTFCK